MLMKQADSQCVCTIRLFLSLSTHCGHHRLQGPLRMLRKGPLTLQMAILELQIGQKLACCLNLLWDQEDQTKKVLTRCCGLSGSLDQSKWKALVSCQLSRTFLFVYLCDIPSNSWYHFLDRFASLIPYGKYFIHCCSQWNFKVKTTKAEISVFNFSLIFFLRLWSRKAREHSK